MQRKAVPEEFKWRHYEPEIIMCCVRWYLRYCLSYRDLAEMMQERGLGIVHSTIYRWIQYYAKGLERKIRPHFRTPNGSWRVDETYIKVKGKWHYLYRAVDKYGDTIDFYLSQTRNAEAAKRFFTKALDANGYPSVVTVDKNPAYPVAIEELQTEKKLPGDVRLRQVKYLNNIVEQDHRRIKRKSRHAMGYFSYATACITIYGIEIINMIFKGQLGDVVDRTAQGLKNFIHAQFGLAEAC